MGRSSEVKSTKRQQKLGRERQTRIRKGGGERKEGTRETETEREERETESER